MGDWVLADDPNTPGGIVSRQVADTFVRETSTLVDLYVDGELISTTGEHPFWVPGQGWVEAQDLQIGSLLQTDEETFVDVDRIEKREGKTKVYNFSVEGIPTYFVSEHGILVHNACQGGNNLTGSNWQFTPSKDLDLRGTGATYKDALDEAFKRIEQASGITKDQLKPAKWAKDVNGKTIPVEYEGPRGAQVNMDIPQWNNVKANGALGEGPHQPHVGYQTPGKGKNRVRGHIFVDSIPATRR